MRKYKGFHLVKEIIGKKNGNLVIDDIVEPVMNFQWLSWPVCFVPADQSLQTIFPQNFLANTVNGKYVWIETYENHLTARVGTSYGRLNIHHAA